jgi:tetratricopeptide (TPR) repeat protein
MKLSLLSPLLCALTLGTAAGTLTAGTFSASAHAAAHRATAPAAQTALQKGRAYMQKGDYKDAEAQFKLAVKQSPHSVAAYEQLGLAALYYRDYPESYKAFTKAVQFTPKDTKLLYWTATAGLYSGSYADARNYVDALLQLKPRYVAAWHLRFLLDTNLLDRKAQLADAKHVLNLSPKNRDALNDAGMAYANNSKPKVAYGYFTRAIAKSPKDWELYKNRSIVDGMLKHAQAEISDLRRAIALAPDAGDRKVLQAALAKVIKATKLKHK